jgi:hypothetical protein
VKAVVSDTDLMTWHPNKTPGVDRRQRTRLAKTAGSCIKRSADSAEPLSATIDYSQSTVVEAVHRKLGEKKVIVFAARI